LSIAIIINGEELNDSDVRGGEVRDYEESVKSDVDGPHGLRKNPTKMRKLQAVVSGSKISGDAGSDVDAHVAATVMDAVIVVGGVSDGRTSKV
jgi:hypothetical protein